MVYNFAHRGFSAHYPENTMLAFEKAVEADCDGIELDVQLSKDGQLVIIHDEKVNRTTDGKGQVCDFTLEQLKELDASAKFSGVYGENEIPTLEEYLSFVQGKPVWTNIELKNSVNPYDGMEAQVLSCVKKYGYEDRVIFSSFNHYSVLKMKKLAPKIPCGFLEESWVLDFPLYAKQHNVEFVHPVYYAVTKEFAKQAAENEIGINTWTVNREEDMRRMINLGVRTLITNHPDLCKKVIKEMQSS